MTAAGMKFCQGSYAQQQFNILMNELFALGKTYERVSFCFDNYF
jgi:hypothetical protein